jgi:hypothetical protein
MKYHLKYSPALSNPVGTDTNHTTGNHILEQNFVEHTVVTAIFLYTAQEIDAYTEHVLILCLDYIFLCSTTKYRAPTLLHFRCKSDITYCVTLITLGNSCMNAKHTIPRKSQHTQPTTGTQHVVLAKLHLLTNIHTISIRSSRHYPKLRGHYRIEPLNYVILNRCLYAYSRCIGHKYKIQRVTRLISCRKTSRP